MRFHPYSEIIWFIFLPLVAILIDGNNNALWAVQLVEVVHEAEVLGKVVARCGNWAITYRQEYPERFGAQIDFLMVL